MTSGARHHSPAAERNRVPLLAALQRLLPEQGLAPGLALEIASGTGQHAAFFATALPGWRWQPTENSAGFADCAASIIDWCGGLPNVAAPLPLDVNAAAWADVPAQVDLVFCANLLHIAPWPATAGLMRGAARHLAPAGRLLVYGPFVEDGVATAASNLAFDADLRARDPRWGLRRLADVAQQAAAAGMHLQERVQMPANNLLLVFGRSTAAT